MEIEYSDYSNGLVNPANSVLKHYGAKCRR